MHELLHAGFDTLDVAFAGAFSEDAHAVLESAREEATASQEPVLIELGPGKVAMKVASHGMRGGYAFSVDTGPLGAKWFIKKNTDPRKWNVFASPKATTLLALGYHKTRDWLFRELEAMGATVTDHSINRVDFAMDFRTRGFALKADNFVAHSHTKIAPHWSQAAPPTDRNQPSAVLRGRRLESVTIGKMPGRQIIVYDKRREAVERQKRFWFDVWRCQMDDPTLEVWRIEVRAGKKELKDRWNLRRFDDFETAIGDVCVNALDQVRYLADGQSDSNVSRRQEHSLWLAAQEVARRDLLDFRAGLTPNQVREIERDQAQRLYSALSYSSLLGFAVSKGIADEDIASEFATLAAEAKMMIAEDHHRHDAAVRRMRKRLHFVQEQH